ncbi:MAG: hypothetical protein LBK60_03340 [Verrucomicrobiales bacterium]|jgi:IS5 family transposase|nr:hypothetical protein [Verrucomicrobiales bacterium]
MHLLADQWGWPLRFILTGGERNDCTQASALLAGTEATSVIADRDYDTDDLRAELAARNL